MKLVTLLVLVAAGAVSDFPLANHLHLVLVGGIVVRMHRKRKVHLVAHAFVLVAYGTHPKLSDTLVRVYASLLEVHYRQAGGVFRIRHKSIAANALLVEANRVGRPIGAVRIMLAGCFTGGNNRVARVLIHHKVI